MVHHFAKKVLVALIFRLAIGSHATGCSKRSHSITERSKVLVRIASVVCILTQATVLYGFCRGRNQAVKFALCV